MKSNNFSGGFNLILSYIKSSLDFVWFKSLNSCFKTVLKSSEHGSNSLIDVTSQIWSVNCWFEWFSIKSSYIIVMMSWFFSSWWYIINISYVFSCLLISSDCNTLRCVWILLEEIFNSSLSKHMFIFSECTGIFTFNLSKYWGFTSSLGSG